MLRGITTFVCDNCGHKFRGLDIEWRATIHSQPLKCPKCGSYQTRPIRFIDSIINNILRYGKKYIL